MKKIVSLGSILFIFNIGLHAEGVFTLYISDVVMKDSLQVGVVGVVFNEWGFDLLEAEHISVKEQRYNSTVLSYQVLYQDSSVLVFGMSYLSDLEADRMRKINVTIYKDGLHNGSEGQDFIININKGSVVSGNDKAFADQAQRALSHVNVDAFLGALLPISKTKLKEYDVIDYNNLVGKTFFIYDSCEESTECSFLAFSRKEFDVSLRFEPNAVIRMDHEDYFEFFIKHVQKGYQETKLMVQDWYSGNYLPWFLSYNDAGLLSIRSLEGNQINTQTYIDEVQLDYFTCLSSYKEDDYEMRDDYTPYERDYTHYYLIKESQRSLIRYVAYYKGCPLRQESKVQSAMERYLLQGEPLKLLREIDSLWLEVEDIFGNVGFVERKHVTDSTL